ncbi:hypothetical protein P3X46_029937 [Hevea brasiliensis]|uniref:YTH domain-containing family protein n=1 Tax=Hevea brasiliensis TaxID=3981 RepID=A0ABQ9KUN9_HEVBR|nr:uncharacterized protein LOC131174732 isoform X1 [Hevea brasiliensis]KAJ9147819.1 hypothetical protein P3X46_029937 [Hevea brasiliensis]
MSSDTAKENASVVDSSVTEWKHDMGNFDDPESPIYEGDEDSYPNRAEKAGCDQVGNSSLNKRGRLYNTRYFIIKSLNHHNIQLSVEKGIWATQVMNEPILEEAFHNSGKVILIFSVNMSGFFQGYAQMMSSVGWRRDNIWSQGCGKGNPWGRSFKVKWLQLNDLPFQKTLHLKNPLNDYKPVKISRDCQELPEDVGEALCELIDGESDSDGMLKRDDLSLKRPFIVPSCSLGDEGYNIHSLHMPWVRTSMPYTSCLYQHGAEASRFHLAHQGPSGVNLPLASSASKMSRMKQSQLNGSLANLQVQCDVRSRNDAWALSAESPLASTLTEDDFLEMTYEEYLEVHSRSVKQLNLPVVGSSRATLEPSRRHDDDSNSSFVTEKCPSRKRTHHSSDK